MGSTAASAIGSAIRCVTFSSASCSVSSSVRTGTCFVRIRFASSAASPLSSYDSSANCAENVCTLSTPMNFDASAARIDESIPPLMKTPTGTSDITCFSTARSMSRCVSRTASVASYGSIRVPQAYWTPHTRNAFFSARDVLTFYDTQIHAWYRLRLDSKGRPAELKMVAGAHFMHHDYSFRSPAISPPSR